MLYFFDRTETLVRLIDKSQVKEAIVTERLNTAAELNATVLSSADLSSVFFVAHKDVGNLNTIKLYKIIKTSWNGDAIDLHGIETAYDDLLADGYIQDQRPAARPITDVVANILDGSRWLVGTSASTNTVTGSFYFVSRLEALHKAMQLAGTEFLPRIEFDGHQITGRYIDIFNHIGADHGKRYVHGSNLLEIVRDDYHAGLYTAIIGRGKGEEAFDEDGNPTGAFGRRISFTDVEWSIANGDPVDKPIGQRYVEIPDYTAAYGYPDGKPRIGIFTFQDIDDPIQLLQASYDKALQVGRPQVTYKTNVLDDGTSSLGDVVSIIRPSTIETDEGRVFHDIPQPPYSEGDVWVQPEVDSAYWTDKDVSGNQITSLDFDGYDMVGGNSYVAINTKLIGVFNRADWERTQADIRFKVRIIRRILNLLTPNYIQVELGDRSTNYVAERIRELKDQLDIQQNEYQDNLQNVLDNIDRATDFYWGEDGWNYDLEIGNEYGLPAGLYSFDKPIDEAPTKWVYVGAGKVVIANEKNPDGTWKLKTFLDGDGLAADTVSAHNIIAGAVNADHIEAGSIFTEHIAAEGISADYIRLADSTTAETAITELIAGQLSIRGSLVSTFSDIPEPPYKAGDIWQQPEVLANYWPNKDLTGNQIVALDFDGYDMIGGNSYIAVSDRPSGNFVSSDWVRTSQSDAIAQSAITDIRAGQAAFVKYIDIDRPSATVIDGGNLKTGTVNADKIAAGAITAAKIAAGAITADMIKAGRLESINGGSYFDLGTGFIKAGSGEFSGRIMQGDNTASLTLGDYVSPSLGVLKGLHMFDHNLSTQVPIASMSVLGGSSYGMELATRKGTLFHNPRIYMSVTDSESYLALRTGNCALQMTSHMGWDIQSLNGHGFGTTVYDEAPVIFIDGAEYRVKVTGDGILRYE